MAKRLSIQFFNETTKEDIKLDINPASFENTSEVSTISQDVINYGEVVLFGKKRCKRVSFESLFAVGDSITTKAPALFTGFLSDVFDVFFSQQETVEKIQKWQEDNNIIRVLVSDYFNETMKISSFSPVYAEANKIIHYNLSFIEHRDPFFVSEDNNQKGLFGNGLLGRAVSRAIPKFITGNSTDDLYSVATKYTGVGAEWGNLARINGIFNSDTSIVGKVINLK